MNRLIHLSLIMLVFACPMWCAAAHCVNDCLAVQAMPTCCCQGTPQTPEQPEAPAPEKRSQCICGGAVLADAFDLDSIQFLEVWFATNQNQIQHSLDSSLFEQLNEFDSPPPVSGRTLRHWHMSLTI